MKIVCTAKEQEAMMFALFRSTECPVVLADREDCPAHLGNLSCAECMLKNIEWKVIDGES